MALSRALFCALSLVSQSARFKRDRQLAATVSFNGVEVHNYRENNKEWVVFFKAKTSESSIKAFCGGKCDFQGHPDKKGVAFAKFHGGEEELVEVLKGQSDVKMIETDDLVYAIPEIESFETTSMASWGLERIGAGNRAFTGKGVHIYVQDTGIRSTHGDFGGRASGAFDMTTGGAGLECEEGSVTCALDAQGHGSHCAGTAAGTTFGVAPDAKVYAVKTLSDEGSGQRSWQYEGIDWVATNGHSPAVLSMSLGGNGKDTGYDDAFEATTEAGVVVVVAAGNSNADTCGFSPAFASAAITVGATDSNNERAYYSNYGTCNDIMAPGSAIVSAINTADTGSVALSGTSMACPHVAGAAALLLEQDGSRNREQVLQVLKEKALQNFISYQMSDDPNYFLWVSSEAAVSPPDQPPTATPAPCRRRYFC